MGNQVRDLGKYFICGTIEGKKKERRERGREPKQESPPCCYGLDYAKKMCSSPNPSICECDLIWTRSLPM